MYNGEFKIIDTQEKAYMLGQLYGDGYNGESGKSYKTSLASIDKDAELYQHLNHLFPFFTLKHYKSHPNMVYLEANCKELYLDLCALGMVSNKTEKDKTEEFHFPQLEESLLPHFIRGYFDADGSAWYPTRQRSRNNLHIEFGCNTPKFLSSLNDILNANGICFSTNKRMKRAGNGKFYMSHILFSSNYTISIKFANYIYKDSIIELSYKKALCYRPKQLRPKLSAIYGNCPYCGSDHIIGNGIRNGNQRMECKKCNKQFSRPLPK